MTDEPDMFATSDDLERRWHKLTDEERQKADTHLADVTFDTIERNDLEPPFTEATLADSMQGMSTPISQYVRLRLGVRCMKEDHTGDWDKAARLWASIAREIIRLGTVAPLISASLESGPVRMTDEDKRLVSAYGVLLLEVTVN